MSQLLWARCPGGDWRRLWRARFDVAAEPGGRPRRSQHAWKPRATIATSTEPRTRQRRRRSEMCRLSVDEHVRAACGACPTWAGYARSETRWLDRCANVGHAPHAGIRAPKRQTIRHRLRIEPERRSRPVERQFRPEADCIGKRPCIDSRCAKRFNESNVFPWMNAHARHAKHALHARRTMFGKKRLRGSYFATDRDRLGQLARQRGVHHLDNLVPSAA